jgi:transaldolase
MNKNLYEQLSDMTIIVADTGDLASIETFKPRDATTNPSLITAAAQMEQYSDVVDSVLRRAGEEIGNNPEAIVDRAIDRLSVEFGTRILNIVSGRVSTEVDARLSYDMKGTIAKAHELIGYYREAGVN